jgi:hypothetical protein
MKQHDPEDFLRMAETAYSRQQASSGAQPVPYGYNVPPESSDEIQEPSDPAEIQLPKLNLGRDDDLPEGVTEFADQVGQTFQQVTEQLKSATRRNEELRQQLQQAADQQKYEVLFAQFDRAADALDESRYGRGRMATLPAGQQANRQALLDAVAREEQRLEAYGLPRPPLEAMIAAADRRLTSSFSTPAIQKVATKSKGRAGKTTVPPSSSHIEDNKTPRERATEVAARKMREMGMLP